MPDILWFPIGMAVVLGVYSLLQARFHREPLPQYPSKDYEASAGIIRLTTTNNDQLPVGTLFSDLGSISEEDG